MKKLLLIFFCLSIGSASAQSEINWLDFEQLEVAILQKPKPVFIYFYADWCVYCKKMDRYAFKDKMIIKELEENFYAVKMNAESTDTIHFEGSTFYNDETEHKRNPTHQIAKLLASRKDIAFTLPAILIFDEKFSLIDRKFTYLTTQKMLEFIETLR